MKLIDIVKQVRSKNAGPLFLTIDIIFYDGETFKRVEKALTAAKIAQLYGIQEKDVSMIPYEIVNAIKITIPRKWASCALEDDDIYGCQKHMPLAMMEIPE